MGGFTLRDDQRETVARVHRALRGLGGALVADPPGTGKTVIALAVARRYAGTTVLAPAALRAQWERAAARARLRIRFASYESLSRTTGVPAAPLVVLDEAHHARTPRTRRYARIADGCVGAHVLLLTATPVVNRRADRDALLALFLGARAATLSAEELARVIVRRRDTGGLRPVIRRLPPLEGAADVPGLARALRGLPPPLPAADGTAALALIRTSLVMAWRSSLAALDTALRRRLQRGGALRDALAAGRWPDRRALRDWVLGDDATQLAFAEFLAAPSVADLGTATRALSAHLDAIGAVRALIGDRIAADTACRADAIRALRDAHPDRRLVVFAAHAETIRALWGRLRHDAGTIAITSTRTHAAAGRWSRAEVLAALGPRAAPLRLGHPRTIRVLLATDLLAEGVELQGVRSLVHADRAWTPARHEQREGRIARAGAMPGEVLVTRFRAPREAVALLQLEARLTRKRRVRTAAVRAADAAARAARILERWRAWPEGSGRIATLQARHTLFLALVRAARGDALVVGRRDRRRWHVSRSPCRVAAVVRSIDRRLEEPAADGDDGAPRGGASEALVRAIRRLLATEARLRAARDLLHGGSAKAGLQRRLRSVLDHRVQRSPIDARGARADDADAVLRLAAGARGAGAERALARWLRDGLASNDHRLPSAHRPGDGPRTAGGAKGDPPRPRLVALLALAGPEALSPAPALPPGAPGRHAPPSASP